MKLKTNRRDFLKKSALMAAGMPLASRTARAQSANNRLNLGMIGVGGRGEAHLRALAGENIVALCDVDDQNLAKAAAQFPNAARFHDFRRLLERAAVDAVVIATADHTHALAASMAMKLGKHVYCEKPLTHSVAEARSLANTAAKQRVATQMGNQGHSMNGVRRIVEIVQSGLLGGIYEVHAWTDRPIWPQGIDRPTETPPVPAHVRWDLWLGPAPARPYHEAYHPFKWRGWWDFGTGAVGDMGCHVLDPAFWALKLGYPATVAAEGPPPHPETAPKWEILHLNFPRRDWMPPVKVTWYDGGKLPPADLFEGEKIADNGSLLIGERGKVYIPDPYGARHVLLPRTRFAGFQPPDAFVPNSPGQQEEWTLACKTGSPTGSHFGYASLLTEALCLGVIAYRTRKRLEWDGPNMRVVNCREADGLLRREYRPGWTL